LPASCVQVGSALPADGTRPGAQKSILMLSLRAVKGRSADRAQKQMSHEFAPPKDVRFLRT